MITLSFGTGIGIFIMLLFEHRYKKLYELEKERNNELERRIRFLESDNKYNDAILQNHCSRIGELEKKN